MGKKAVIIFIILFSLPSFACDKNIITAQFEGYVQQHMENYNLFSQLFKELNVGLKKNYVILNSRVLQKIQISDESFEELSEVESKLASAVDALYESHSQLLQVFGEEPIDDNIFSGLLNCYPEKNSQLEALILLHISEVKLEESNISSMIDTLYAYSTKILSLIESYEDWLFDNESNDIPQLGQFDDLDILSMSSKNAQKYTDDILSLTSKNLCQISITAGISLRQCAGL